jgi:hypothetical protein
MKMLNVVNDTSNWMMEYQTAEKFTDFYLNSDVTRGAPRYYSFNGIDDNGDTIVEVYPPPDGEYLIRFNLVNRQADLSADTDLLLVPTQSVIQLAYAKAVEERGEDGGQSGLSAYNTAQRVINDAISLDCAKHPEETIWYTV